MVKKKIEKTIEIHNVKNDGFRQVHVDGAQGGITPNGFLNLNFYGQRGVIPTSSVFSISDEGDLGELLGNGDDSKNGIIREFEFGVYMDVNTCKSLKIFLEQKIEEFKELSITK